MPVRKVADIKIRTSSKGRSVVTGSGTKFYSYDKDSAAIDFHFFDQDGSPTDLLNSEIKLMLLTKESDNWKKFTIFDNDLEILSRIKGRARYIIPDTLRGYQGVVQGYVYLNFADGSRTDECYFTFTIERSKIEEEFENAGGYFIKEIQEVFDEVKEDLKNMRPQMETEIKDLQDGLDQAGTGIVDANAKIKDIQENVEKYRGPKGDTGDASYTHVAWKMADGTFTTEYPGENLFDKNSCIGGILTVTGVVSTSSADSIVQIATPNYVPISGEAITVQMWNPNLVDPSTYTARMAYYDSEYKFISVSQYKLQPINYRYLIYNIPQGASYARMGVIIGNNKIVDPEIKWKFELGSTPTIYTPAPSEDYVNAYPKYRGEYTDTIEADSTNPDDYTWTAYLGERGPIGKQGNQGDSAYQVWLNQGNTGTESDFLNSFKVGYTKEESDQKFATKTSVLPAATDAEAITGAATNKLITPKNLQTFYEDRQKISVARFGLSDLDPTSVEKFSEASWRYRRTGNQVEFFGRFNFKVAGDSFSTVHTLPVGFRLSADFDDTSWNVPLSAAKFSSLSTYLAAGFVERMGTNFLKVASTTTGNVYFYGRWYTDDPFPLG